MLAILTTVVLSQVVEPFCAITETQVSFHVEITTTWRETDGKLRSSGPVLHQVNCSTTGKRACRGVRVTLGKTLTFLDAQAITDASLVSLAGVTTDEDRDHFHRDHRGPRDHPVIAGRFFARSDSASAAQGQSARR